MTTATFAADPTTDIAFRVEPKPFATITDQVARRLPRKPTIPTLAGLLLEVADERLTVSAFDYDVAASAVVDVTGDSDGRAVVSGRLLAELVKTFPDKPVTARIDGARLAVTCGAVKLTLPLMPADEYPALPAMPPTVGTIDAEAFAAAVTRVYPASDATGANKVAMLTGIHLRIDGDHIAVEGSDRYRGAIADLPWIPADPNVAAAILVSATVLYEAAKTYGAGSGPVTVGFQSGDNGGLIGFSGDGGSIVARVLTDKYPPLNSYFPARHDQPTTVRVDELATALKRAQLVHEPKSPVRLTLTADQIELNSADGDTNLGDAVDCVHHDEPVTIGVNPDYLLDALGTLRSAVAELHIGEPKKPFMLTAPDDRTYRHLIMPIRPS